jgi:hypothetical protein
MECESYNLNWAEFDTYTSLTFKQLLMKPDFTDVTLACEGDESVEAHKVILSACSPFFDRILKKNSHAHPLIYLTDVTQSDMKAIINFMYLGQTNVAQENLQRFLKVATKFEVRGLTDDKKGKKADGIINGADTSDISIQEDDVIAADVQDDLDDSVMGEDDTEAGPDELAIKCEPESSSGFYYEKTEEKDLDSSFMMDGFRIMPGSLPRTPMMDHEKVFPCDQCDYKATFSCNLTSHKRTVHEKLFFQCHLCEYKSSRKDRLNKHVVAKHGVE